MLTSSTSAFEDTAKASIEAMRASGRIDAVEAPVAPSAAPATDHWVLLANDFIAQCWRASTSFVDGILPDEIAAECWGRCIEIEAEIVKSQPTSEEGLIAWLRILSGTERDMVSPMNSGDIASSIAKAALKQIAVSAAANGGRLRDFSGLDNDDLVNICDVFRVFSSIAAAFSCQPRFAGRLGYNRAGEIVDQFVNEMNENIERIRSLSPTRGEYVQ